MKRQIMRRLITYVAFLILPPSSILASTLAAEKILADTPAVYAIAHSLALNENEIALALTQDQDLHHYTLKPSQAALISQSQMLITIGDLLSPKILDSFKTLNPDGKIIQIDAGFFINHDPHFWTSPLKMKQVAQYIDEGLPSRDPSGELLHIVLGELEKSDQLLKSTKFTQGIILGHNAFSSLIADYDIPYFGALTDINDQPAPPKERIAIETAIKNGEVKCLILDSQEPNPDLEDYAISQDINFAYFDVSGWSYSTPDRAQDFFIEYYKNLADTFANCTSDGTKSR